ncbi:hypothetical protein SDRG_12269 [Saprolegnia diclina VS20]|uniref:F-box domain-containing protein n=1 Tax=Saprolegnia diclina (strain VS20) TaxID=1156394 RepID=T0PWX0_SAPDV|nr:hypothetical protein SDRG_12269 [Saprolegnia diclina VS20]EQC29989.1 hypothetical protein SDRG_12269 [Saprolegnia diclina VS20]|eukprot:XP_008616556.1 hypothetical protein SDRG_12269 [Saprolegnia diclina VS20]
MTSRRSQWMGAPSPTAFKLDHVLVAIVQCLEAPIDVKAFLSALPASARSPPLAALLQLLQRPLDAVISYRHYTEHEAVEHLWPMLKLAELAPTGARLARDALPVVTAAMVFGVPMDPAGLEALQAWSKKVIHYTHPHVLINIPLPRLCSVLRECIKLQSFDARNVSGDASPLDAVTTPAHRLSFLAINCPAREAAKISAIGRWLDSAYAETLVVSFFASDDPRDHDALSLMLPKTVALSTLDMCLKMPGLLAPLVAVAPSFTRLTRLRIKLAHASDMPVLVQLLTCLDGQRLTMLHITCPHYEYVNFGVLLDVLPSFPVLEDLSLARGSFAVDAMAPTARLPSTLRRVAFTSISFDGPAWNAFAAGLSSAYELESLTWLECKLSTAITDAIMTTLPDWIRRGIQSIAMHKCDVSNESIMRLAAALPHTTSRLGAAFDIVDEYELSGPCYIAVDQALTTSEAAVPVLRQYNYRYEYVAGRRSLVLESPA